MRKAASRLLDEQRNMAHEWIDARPEMPSTRKPQYHETILPFGISRPLFFIGVAIAIVLLMVVQPKDAALIMFFILGVPALTMFGLPFVVYFSFVIPRFAVYSHRMKKSGWARHQRELLVWHQEGEERFRQFAKQDNVIALLLRMAQPTH